VIGRVVSPQEWEWVVCERTWLATPRDLWECLTLKLKWGSTVFLGKCKSIDLSSYDVL
jgi:hypothetical protein